MTDLSEKEKREIELAEWLMDRWENGELTEWLGG